MFKFTDFMTRSVRTLIAMVFGALLLFGSIEAAAQTHNCWCEIKCTSDQNGQTYTQSAKSVGPAFSWPITPAKHDQCSNRCLGLAQDEGKIVADAGKLCKTGNCSGKSWIGTEIGGFRMTINNVDFNNTDKLYCKGPTGSGCCPGYLENANLLQMSKHESAAGGNVTETILTGPQRRLNV